MEHCMDRIVAVSVANEIQSIDRDADYAERNRRRCIGLHVCAQTGLHRGTVG
jgi:hypothetical protein